MNKPIRTAYVRDMVFSFVVEVERSRFAMTGQAKLTRLVDRQRRVNAATSAYGRGEASG